MPELKRHFYFDSLTVRNFSVFFRINNARTIDDHTGITGKIKNDISNAVIILT